MRSALILLAKSNVIAIAAALAASGYLLAYSRYSGGDPAPGYLEVTFYASLIGSYAIGLPVALLVFWMARQHLVASPVTLAMITALAAIMMVLASFVIGDKAGMIMLGAPAAIAGAIFGILGWFWIIKPLREGRHD